MRKSLYTLLRGKVNNQLILLEASWEEKVAQKTPHCVCASVCQEFFSGGEITLFGFSRNYIELPAPLALVLLAHLHGPCSE